ncbi:MAG TPA: DISARM system SNF2-like helicase DrmD, partial [Thermoanaerobaculia bacterium]|nr:DISARM system SNF2-like helicase DrmD [Thermoanaerobaculia bacterium]
MSESPTLAQLLEVLTKDRLVDLGRRFEVAVRSSDAKAQQITSLQRAPTLDVASLIPTLGRDELRAACRRFALGDSGRSRAELANRLIAAFGDELAEPFAPAFATEADRPYAPQPGDVVLVRHRQYLVEDVFPPAQPRQQTLVRLTCLDDDHQGHALDVLWELELGARVLAPEASGLGDVDHLDEPSRFGAYVHALRWNSVTATDPHLFQSPFRAGIQLIDHQLIPLKKALELPRANLFIADDVGLGKTIEAGLVLQELVLRQRVDFALIICPYAICLQWRDEMAKRFGLQFEIYSRAFVAARRRERGFAVNPWATHNRFIVSHSLIRRPEYRDPLLQVLGLERSAERARKSLLILDEAHVAAPASASKYAIDSRITRTIRDIAPRFENRLFLSATPHNGHSNSFSALLEILDPQRFTRGVPVTDPEELEPVLVRRLKSDLRALGVGKFPERRVLAVELVHGPPGWAQSIQEVRDGTRRQVYPESDQPEGDTEPIALDGASSSEPLELQLAEELAAYRDRLESGLRKRERLVLASLQKRLLSSAEAFYRTLQVHARGLRRRAEAAKEEAQAELEAPISDPDADPTEATTDADFPAEAADADDEYGADDEQTDAAEAATIEHESVRLANRFEGQLAHVERMLQLATTARGVPDAKTLALVDWIRRCQCAGAQIGGSDHLSATERRWNDRRILVFTEYGDTKRYLLQVLRTAIRGTDREDERILQFHGGMSDEQREQIQQAFNDPQHPVRILVATDAAREGVNLQGSCADLFHFDIPWNPARMEQRNGRIDRTLQESPEVRCHYFRYPQRTEDVVLEKLVEKVETIRKELGSLGSVILDRLEGALAHGIGRDTLQALDATQEDRGRRETARTELETQRDLDSMRREIDEAGEILNDSRDHTGFDAEALRHVVRAGLGLNGLDDLQ